MSTNTIRRPSIERPWMKYYPPIMLDMIKMPNCTVKEYLLQHCPGMDVAAIQYYGEMISWDFLFKEADQVARSLRALGFGEGDQIPIYFRLVPEFISLLLAAETIGASLLCRDNTTEENAEAAQKAGAKTIITHDFLSESEKKVFQDAGVEKFILAPALQHGSKEGMADFNVFCYESYYTEHLASGPDTMNWDEFLALGNDYTGTVEAPVDITRPLFRAYTSGSTGPSKQVIHSAETMLGIICQMNFYGGADDYRPTWLVTNLPPALVACVVSMVLLPMSSNKLLIMDPFVFNEDVDLELMYLKPNNWPLIPMFIETVMRNGRIPEDYDLSHLLAAGAGSEAFNNNQLARAQKFCLDHNCKIRFTTGYGSSEAGSNMTLPMAPKPLGNGNVGVPMPLSNMGVFKPGTTEELSYNEIGEICKTGPGNMLGYDNPEATAKALMMHDDGNIWLHSGDLGYVDEDGIFYTLNRGQSLRYDGGELVMLVMENKLADANIPGIDDEWFVIVPDRKHQGYFLPYLYVVLKDGYTVDDIREAVDAALEPHERPYEIRTISKRPFFHYKTNRIGLTREILGE